MRINLVAVGKLKERFWQDAISEYAKRLKSFCQFQVIEVSEEVDILKEADNIKRFLKGHIIVFDIYGHMYNSPQFADIFAKQLNKGISEFSLVIGGSTGLHTQIKELAGSSVSFGLVTYPHQLMRVIATEQIYRAMTILHNRTYHK